MSDSSAPFQNIEPLAPRNSFSVPLWLRRVPDHAAINLSILERMETLKVTTPAEARSSVGGWQSQTALQKDPALAPLRAAIVHMSIAAMKSQSFDFSQADLALKQLWLNENGPRDFNKTHIHPHALLSGVYYLRTPPESGELELQDPITVRQMMTFPTVADTPATANMITVRPEEGLMVLFPAWLHHNVTPNQSDAPRVSAAFNIGYQMRAGA